MTSDNPVRRILGPFNRVEGGLEVRIEVGDGRITRAWVNSPLFRGYEQILHGKDPRDALVYTPRICGICSVSQSVAAASALAAAQGLRPTPNGRLATNLILAAENLAGGSLNIRATTIIGAKNCPEAMPITVPTETVVPLQASAVTRKR